MVWAIIVGALAITLGSGAFLGAAIGLTGLIILHFQAGGLTSLAVPAVWNVFSDYTLAAVPIFIFLGEILLRGGVSDRLYSALTPLFHRVPGRLLQTNVWVCTIFGACCGSSAATAAAVGSVAYPELGRRGYNRPQVLGSLAGAGVLGLMVPPSLSLLIYGAMQDVSIGKLFLAGILPALLIAGLFSLYVGLLAVLRPESVPAAGPNPGWRLVLRSLLGVWPLPILIFAVLGTIYGGFATVTEAAGLGVAVAIIMGFAWGTLTPRKLWEAFVSGSRILAAIVFVILGTLILAQAVANLGLPRKIFEAVSNAGLSSYEVLLVVTLVYFILGCFFDGLSLMIMTLPMVFPLMTGLGFDPVWLGIIITMMIEIGAITPPVGLNLYVLLAISHGEVSLPAAARATVPYWGMLVLAILILTVFPSIALYLPGFL